MELKTKNLHVYRKLLGKTGEKLTDRQIAELKNAAVVLADLVIDDYIAKKEMKQQMETQYGHTK